MILYQTLKKERRKGRKHRLTLMEVLRRKHDDDLSRSFAGIMHILHPEYITDRDIQPYLHRMEEGLTDP